MKFHLEIDVDNADFEYLETGIQKVLNRAAAKIGMYKIHPDDDPIRLKDTNGNTVGEMWLSETAQEEQDRLSPEDD